MDRLVVRASKPGRRCGRCWPSVGPKAIAASGQHEVFQATSQRSFVNVSSAVMKFNGAACGRSARRHFGIQHGIHEGKAKDYVPTGTEGVLFQEVFEPFGVKPEQFRHIMSVGTSIRASKGGLVVQGGEINDKIILVLQGEATAYKTRPIHSHLNSLADPHAHDDVEDGKPVCIYRGKCEKNLRARTDLPVRGSTIGGSAYVAANISGTPYPCTIRASSEDFVAIQWTRHDLQETIDQPKMRALQAAVYHLLYVELIETLRKDMIVSAKSKKIAGQHTTKAEVERPTAKQLMQYSIFIAVPFFGFGFADNVIMIVCGDAIDARFGVVLGLSTMAAAGLGNWISDVVGLSLGDAIERSCEKLGLSNGRLTPAQLQLNVAKWTTLVSRCIGISLGCFAGMCPLLFLSSTKKEFREEDLEIYNEIFLPNGVSTDQFAELMERGQKSKLRPGNVIIQAKTFRSKIILILRGKAHAIHPNHIGQENCVAHHSYHGRLEKAPAPCRETPIRGTIIGASIVADPDLLKVPYPYQIVTTTDVELIEWELTDLRDLMAQEKAVEASFYNLLYSELRKKVKSDNPFRYKELLRVVVADGIVNEKERVMILEMRKKLNITEEEHYELLREIGWTGEAWHKGFMDSDAPRQKISEPPGSLVECVSQLQQASTLISDTMESIMKLDIEPGHAFSPADSSGPLDS